MVHLITGNINSGKTTKLMELFRSLHTGDGIACPKYFQKNRHVGYNIVHLRTGTCRPFAWKTNLLPDGWTEAFQFSSYSFSKEGQELAKSVINSLIVSGTSPVFLDEIGPVELTGMGFSKLVHTLLNSGLETYISIRSSCLEDSIRYFNIEKFLKIDVENERSLHD